MKNNKGFTIVELMVVIAILGLLGTIAAISFTRYKENAIEKEKVTLRQNIISSFGMYRIDNGIGVGDPETDLILLDGIFNFNGKKCDGLSGTIKVVQESTTSKKEIYCVQMKCNNEEPFIIDDYSENSDNSQYCNR